MNLILIALCHHYVSSTLKNRTFAKKLQVKLYHRGRRFRRFRPGWCRGCGRGTASPPFHVPIGCWGTWNHSIPADLANCHRSANYVLASEAKKYGGCHIFLILTDRRSSSLIIYVISTKYFVWIPYRLSTQVRQPE